MSINCVYNYFERISSYFYFLTNDQLSFQSFFFYNFSHWLFFLLSIIEYYNTFLILYNIPNSMKDQKLRIEKSVNLTPISTPNSLISQSEQVQQAKKSSMITNYYIQQLKQIFSKRQQLTLSWDQLINIFSKSETYFITQLVEKLPLDDCKALINNLSLCEKPDGAYIIERGKKSQFMYLLLQGEVSYNIKSQVEQEQLVRIGTSFPGFIVNPEIFMSPRYVNFTIKCERNSTFLALSEQTYNKYLKKYIIREVDTVANFFEEVTIFNGIGAINIRKYLPYFIVRRYKYNEMIYSQGNQSEQIFFILKGEVQLYSKSGENHINIVKLGYRECFGLDLDKNERKYYAKSIDSELKLFVLNKKVLEIIKIQNKCVEQNCQMYIMKKQKLHCNLVSKNIKLLTHVNEVKVKITKRKKKNGKKKNKNSLAWWGLAENVKIQQKYRMPIAPESRSAKKLNEELKPVKSQLLMHKINKLKERVFEEEDDQQSEQNQKENSSSPYKINNTYMPKIKRKIKMLEVKPKAIDMAEIIKKKLVTYARNMGSFCDRLNLQ